jgi:multiple sugar transport system ATP-binding protein
MASIELREVSKRFGAVHAVADVSLTVGDREFVVLLGPTGAGKTTTLRLVAGLERPDRGTVWIGGRDVTAASPAMRDVAFVFQQYSLYPHLSVYDNLAFPLRSPARRLDDAQIEQRVTAVASLLGLGTKLRNRATRLSGGEMQRVALGRALVRTPSIFLMDEPLSSLDAKLRAELRVELKRIQGEVGATILYVTHDQVEAMTLATRIAVIREGHIVQVGTPRDIYERPKNVYVATRLGSPIINLLPPHLLPVPGMPAATATLGVRTEHVRIRLATDGREPAGCVKWIEHLGDRNHLHIAVNGHQVVTLAEPEAPLAVGDDVHVELTNPLYFDADGERLEAGA